MRIKNFKYLRNPGISDSGSHEHQDASLSPLSSGFLLASHPVGFHSAMVRWFQAYILLV